MAEIRFLEPSKELRGHSKLRECYHAWDAWQRRLNGREPTADERAEMSADMRAAMGEGDKSS